MKFGVMFANVGPFGQAEGLVHLAKTAERCGFESLWTVEHVVVPKGYRSPYPYSPEGKMPGPEESPIPDPLVWLAYAAAVTTRIKLATGILILPQRHPVYVAKEVATLDQLSQTGEGDLQLGSDMGSLPAYQEEQFESVASMDQPQEQGIQSAQQEPLEPQTPMGSEPSAQPQGQSQEDTYAQPPEGMTEQQSPAG